MYLNYDESKALARELKKVVKKLPEHSRVAVFPSALALVAVKDELAGSSIGLGAQNIYWVDRGGYTGEVSAAMCKAAGAEYALAGHSERRNIFHETNHDVRQKIEALLAVGITPVVCVGETLSERDGGLAEEIEEPDGIGRGLVRRGVGRAAEQLVREDRVRGDEHQRAHRHQKVGRRQGDRGPRAAARARSP